MRATTFSLTKLSLVVASQAASSREGSLRLLKQVVNKAAGEKTSEAYPSGVR